MCNGLLKSTRRGPTKVEGVFFQDDNCDIRQQSIDKLAQAVYKSAYVLF